MRVLVSIEPRPEPNKVWQREVTWHDNWEDALQYVKIFARGDDPGTVNILIVPQVPDDYRPKDWRG